MLLSLQHHTSLAVQKGRIVGRRNFLRQVTAAGLATGACNWTDAISASADELRSRGTSCILLWMAGGPSQFETFSPKPSHAHGGQTKAIATSVPGIQIAEHLPHCAKVMDELAIIRSMTSKEGNHQRATYLFHHGYLPMGGVKFPTLGSNVAHQIGDAANQLPSYVRIGGRLPNSGAGGFLGVDYDPWVLNLAEQLPQNTMSLSQNPTGGCQRPRKLALSNVLANGFGTCSMNAFDIEREPASLRKAYGPGDFATGCHMARRLVEHGVTFVEVVSKGWDTHQDTFSRTAQLTGQIDQPMAMLIKDLKQRGMLDKTLVVWMGEFGRTPQINARAGRDHYPKAFNAVLAGGGIRGGQVLGKTNPAGTEVTDRPVTVNDFFRTIYHTLNIDADTENISQIGRPIKLVNGGTVVEELLG